MFAQTRRIGPIVAAILLLGLIAMAAPARAELITGSGSASVSGHTDPYFHDGTWYGPYGWSYGYTMSLDATEDESWYTVTADVRIDLRFDADVEGNRQVWKTTMKTAIESKWNNEHTFVLDGVTIASVVDVTYGPYSPTVRVKSGSGNTNLYTWYWGQLGLTSAHEFGHMLGLYDEYWGGALNPDHFVEAGGLMNTVDGNPAMPDRYYQPFVDFVVSLQQVPEPATTTMIISSVLAVLALSRLRRK